MNSTTSFGANFMKDIINMTLNTINEKTKEIYQMLWNALISFLVDHWVAVIIVLIIVLAIAIVKAVMGRWRMLGSILYNYLYFGILFIIGLIWGSDIFVSDLFHLAGTAILYPFCYLVVGLILDVTKVHKFKTRWK